MNEPFVSIVIPAFNAGLTLAETIEACLGQDYPKGRIEIVVVDDGSLDNTRQVAVRFPVKYIYQDRKGPAAARNTGWRDSKGDAVCFTDADCVPYKDWVSKLAQYYDKDDVGAVAGSYAVDSSRYLLDKFVHFEIRYRHSMMPVYINSFGTYNVLLKRAALEKLNGFDSEYSHASGEDSDLSYRLIRQGYRIYFEKDALVGHGNILRFWRYVLVQFRHGYWRMKIYRKNYSMITRDDYGYWKDFAEIFLVLTLLFLFPIGRVKGLVAGGLALVLFMIQLPLALRISFKERDFRYVAFSIVTFIRAFVRIAGGIIGFIRFWIIRK
ncbi:MAG: glycosyltransferase [Candidatus Omnitrophica bacterium]|nr:glycosyltransferase [Candidatus Omnitrophota bacterium]